MMATKKVTKNEEVIKTENEVKGEETIKEVKPKRTSKKAVKPNNTGVVVNCNRLFLRKKPFLNAEVAYVIDSGTLVVIDTEYDLPEFYKIKANGVEGFCVKEYISTD